LVELEATSPDDGFDIKTALSEVAVIFGADITTTAVDDDGWTISFEVEARDLEEALSFAAIRISASFAMTALPQWPLVALRVEDAEYAWINRGFESL
jgi:hypothetical protein